MERLDVLASRHVEGLGTGLLAPPRTGVPSDLSHKDTLMHANPLHPLLGIQLHNPFFGGGVHSGIQLTSMSGIYSFIIHSFNISVHSFISVYV